MDHGESSYRRFLEGDNSAFDEIMKAHFDSLLFFINGFVRDLPAAEDIAIDTFSDLLVHRHRYDFRVSLKTYLFMVGRSRALNHLKAQKRHVHISLEDVGTLPEPAGLPQEDRSALNQALDTLPEDQKLAVYLIYYQALTYREAAKVMKKSEKQVDNLLYRAKKALRIILEE